MVFNGQWNSLNIIWGDNIVWGDASLGGFNIIWGDTLSSMTPLTASTFDDGDQS